MGAEQSRRDMLKQLGLAGVGLSVLANLPEFAMPALAQGETVVPFSDFPANFNPNQPLPLVVLLHGYSSSAAQTGGALGLGNLATSRQFFYAAPDGTVDAYGNRFWNATDACCNFGGSQVDDVAYLMAVVDDMASKYPIDPKRIFFIGHSNGAFMTQRMACEHAERLAAVVSIAGAQNNNLARCTPSEPVPMGSRTRLSGLRSDRCRTCLGRSTAAPRVCCESPDSGCLEMYLSCGFPITGDPGPGRAAELPGLSPCGSE